MSDTRRPWELSELAAAYALHALDADERADFERELAASPELQAEVDALRDATTLLADVEPVAPPARLKADLFARLDATPQVGTEGAEAGSEAGSEAGFAADAGFVVAEHEIEPDVAPAPVPLSAEAVAPIAPVRGVPGTPERGVPADLPTRRSARAEREAQRRWFQRPGRVLAAAAASVALIAGLVVGANWVGPTGWGAQRSVAAVAEAPDAQTTQVEAEGGGEVTVSWSEELARSAVRASDLPDVGGDSVYQLWYIDPSGATSAGTFAPVDGDAFVVLAGTFEPGIVVGMTVEPAGGSDAPTTTPIVVVET